MKVQDFLDVCLQSQEIVIVYVENKELVEIDTKAILVDVKYPELLEKEIIMFYVCKADQKIHILL